MMNNTQTFSTSVQTVQMNNKIVQAQSVGYWDVHGVMFPILKTPSPFHRIMTRILLGWKYMPATDIYGNPLHSDKRILHG